MGQKDLQIVSIFIPLASLPDRELVSTVKNIYQDAKHPSDVYVGIHLIGWTKAATKTLKKEIANVSQNVKYCHTRIPFSVDKKLKALGVGAGRTKAASMYSGQEYVLQIDSHTFLAPDWDEKLIHLHTEAENTTGSTKTILTAYCGDYLSKDGIRKPAPGGDGLFHYPKFVPEKFFKVNLIPLWELVSAADLGTSEKFLPSIKFNANFAFGKADWLTSGSLNPTAMFYDEELTQTISLMHQGYCLVFPNLDYPLVAHLYYPNITKETARKQMYELLNDAGQGKCKVKEQQNYLQTVQAPENKQTVDEYQRWAKLHMILGAPSGALHIPKTFHVRSNDER